MSMNQVLAGHAELLSAELGRQYPQVEIVEPLVVNAIAAVKQRSPSVKVLDDTGLIQKFVGTAYVCRRDHWVDQDDWDGIRDRLYHFLTSV